MKKQQEKMILVIMQDTDLDIIKCPSKPPKPQKDDMEV